MNPLAFIGAPALMLARTVRASVRHGLSWRECLPSFNSHSVGRRRSLRVGALALAALISQAKADDEGANEAVFATLPTDFAPVQVGTSEFTYPKGIWR